MTELMVSASSAYRVLIGKGLLAQAGTLAASAIDGRRALIAAGERAFSLYGAALRCSLESAGFSVSVCVYPSGEEYKTPQTLMTIIDTLAREQFSRSDAVFALGGGVTGDMAGLAAALYQRGLACVLLPTTLLAAADASVGGKTAVNLETGKNQMGVFAQPRLVLCDVNCLDSLPAEERREGWAEIIKTAFIQKSALQTLLAAEAPQEQLEQILAESLRVKAGLVEQDERDEGKRQLLNFGHTVGHAIERCSEYRWRHGAAVAAGMAVMTRAAFRRGLCDDACVRSLETLLERFSLPTRCGFAREALLRAIRADKKRRDERIRLVIPRSYGHCECREIAFDELGDWLDQGL